MSLAFRIFIFLIGLCPFFVAIDNLLAQGLMGACVAFMVFMIVVSIPPGEAKFLSAQLRPVMLVAAVPAIWMLIQTLPMPLRPLQHPIWESVQTALGKPVFGSISINSGVTLVTFSYWLSALGLFFVASAVSIDRRRAEIFMLALAAMTTLLAASLIIHDLGGLLFFAVGSSGPRATVSAAAAIGTVLTASTAIFAIERFETRHGTGKFSRDTFVITVATAISAFALCWIAVIFFTSKPAVFAASAGVGTLFLIVGFRRVGASPTMGVLLAIAALGALISLIASELLARTLDITLRFNATSSRAFLELTQRIVADTGWLGSGAGTFPALLPIYQQAGVPATELVAPTTAAGLLIGLGAPVLWMIVISSVAGIMWLLIGALQRGRDSFFAAAGAGCGVLLLVQIFANSSLSDRATVLVLTGVFGIALAQRVSRTSRLS